jgi:hypothetical protein
MKGAPPTVELLFNLCPLCVFAMPIVTIFVLIKLMAKPKVPGATVDEELAE